MSAKTPFEIVVTHGGKFHADDVCAVAFLRILGYITDETRVIRTRDEHMIASADAVLDVGGIYDPHTNRFDHHQSDFNEKRSCGVPYASFGLIVKEFGSEILNPEELAEFDKRFVRLLDGPDSGHLLYEGEVVSLHLAIGWLMPDWDDSDASKFDAAFDYAVEWVTPVIEASMRRAKAKIRAKAQLAAAIWVNEEGTIVEMSRFIPWTEYVCEHYPQAHYVIYPHLMGGYAAQVVPNHPLTFESKCRFPKKWGGMVNEELASASGVSGARFCHVAGFLVVAATLDGIHDLVQKSIESFGPMPQILKSV